MPRIFLSPKFSSCNYSMISVSSCCCSSHILRSCCMTWTAISYLSCILRLSSANSLFFKIRSSISVWRSIICEFSSSALILWLSSRFLLIRYLVNILNDYSSSIKVWLSSMHYLSIALYISSSLELFCITYFGGELWLTGYVFKMFRLREEPATLVALSFFLYLLKSKPCMASLTLC